MLPRAWLSLHHAFVTTAEFHVLLQRFGNVEAIVTRRHHELVNCGLSDAKATAVTSPNEQWLSSALQWLDHEQHAIVCFGDATYPELLAQIPGPPLLLYVNGDVSALHLPSIAIVGSRNPTQGGVKNATEFSKHLASNGFNIASGLAQGIDTAAHRGALQGGALQGGGQTLAFLAHGIDRIYPAGNRALAHEISRCGALLSEYPLGAAPERWHFPERNRLISGISVGTLVIEAARRSGSLITARLAAEQGREVFAVPGSIHNPLARGCHALIRQGAKLTETAADIVSELGSLAGHAEQALAAPPATDAAPNSDDRDYVYLREALSHDPISVDELAAHSGLTIAKLSSMLLILELHGEVEAMSGGRYALLG